MGSSEAEKRAVYNYQRKRDNIMIRPSKESGSEIRAAAAGAGQSVQQYILDAIAQRMERDQQENETALTSK